MKILALIPARSGSKGIKDKNIRILREKPLLAHSIEHARASQLINRCIDAMRSWVITEFNSMTGKKIYGYVMEKNYDIDTETDFQQVLAEFRANVREGAGQPPAQRDPEKRTFCIDIDGVIATKAPGNQYDLASPIQQTINIVNALFEKGHHIILFTARGSLTGIDWRKTTKAQMDAWGVKYHKLVFGKPAADYYVDDKALLLEQFYSLVSELHETSKAKGDNSNE
jgi:hypothetical protein